MPWTVKTRFLDYIGGTGLVHLYLWAVLTPWFFLAIQYSWDQYVIWMWQAPLVALVTNYPMVLLLLKFTPKWRKFIGAPQVCDKCGK